MDPLSIGAGCIALLTAIAQVGNGITKFVVACRDARQDLEAVSAELAGLKMTLDILNSDTDGNDPIRLPSDLCTRISDLIENCRVVIKRLQALLEKYNDKGVGSAVRWTISGKQEVAKIKESLETHKGALILVVEATTVHMATAASTGVGRVAADSSLIKEYTMRIVEQLAKQDEILEQIAWIRGIISQRSPDGHERTLALDRYLDILTDYAGSVCGDSLKDEIAEEMQRGSLDGTGRSGTTILGLTPIMPLHMFDEQPDPMTIVLGNTHRLIEPKEGSENRHLWSFFVNVSGEGVIQEVRICLHPTFSPVIVLLKTAPYKVTRIGWGYFIINVKIKLKPGYLWCDNNTQSLRLLWKLDFSGIGSSRSHEYAVKTSHGKPVPLHRSEVIGSPL